MPQFNPSWKHLASACGVLLSLTLPHFLFKEDEYEYIEIVEEDLDDTEPEKETELDDQQDD